MATYFHGGSEIQANSDGIHTLYLMNPNYVPFSDTHHHHHHNQSPSPPPHPHNMLFLNPAGNALNPASLSHAPPSNNHFVGIPLPSNIGFTNLNDPNRLNNSHHEISTLHGMPMSMSMSMSTPRLHYNLWPPPPSDPTGISSVSATTDSTDMGFRRLPVVSPTQQGGLSLSLSSQQSLYRPSLSAEQEIQVQAISPTSGDDVRVSGNSPTSVSVSVVSSGITGVQSVILGSKYLKATQELLDEVVNVSKGNRLDTADGTKEKMKMKKESTAAIGEASGEGESGGAKSAAELSTAQRQELQMKKAKLIGMLDEVEQKYRQYHQQMQGVVSSFEQAAGLGSAKSYASLALQTISKQFRCLKDAICGQIKATGKSLGEDDSLTAKVEGSRLRYVDHQLRQQRALQQLGMIQHNTWRPQRGLPERAVSVLRAWLFEHFLHPYPKDSDKIILAKQTGLTRSQVSNWFINARVRLWKPMVEEMYLEEIKDQEQIGINPEDNVRNKNEPNNKHLQRGLTSPKENVEAIRMNHHIDPARSRTENLMINQNPSLTDHISNSSISSSSMLGSHSGFNLIRPASDMLGSPKKPRNNLDFSRERQEEDHGYSLMNNNNNNTSNESSGGGFGSYPNINEMGRFNPELLTPRFHGNGVSLTLGLPHSDHNLSLSGTQQNFLSNQNVQLRRRFEMGNGGGGGGGAAQLLPDFVT